MLRSCWYEEEVMLCEWCETVEMRSKKTERSLTLRLGRFFAE